MLTFGQQGRNVGWPRATLTFHERRNRQTDRRMDGRTVIRLTLYTFRYTGCQISGATDSLPYFCQILTDFSLEYSLVNLQLNGY